MKTTSLLIICLCINFILFFGCNPENDPQPTHEPTASPIPTPPFIAAPALPENIVPGWNGQILSDCENLNNWSIEDDSCATSTLEIVSGLIGNALQLNWQLNECDWIQAIYTFTSPVDLSQKDIIGISLKGSESEINNFTIMFADTTDVYFGLSDFNGINTINRWMKNISINKKMFYYFWGPSSDINWSQINRMYIVIKRPGDTIDGGSGQLTFDHIQADTAATWPVQQTIDSVTPNELAIYWAITYIKNQQTDTGLFISWKEEEIPNAYLFDQALALIALTKEGNWQDGDPVNEEAVSAESLAQFLISEQKIDGHWARSWNPNTGAELVDDMWVGDQAWCVLAMMEYYFKSSNPSAFSAANQCSDWLASQIDINGKVVDSTEGNIDVWWAMKATGRESDAINIQNYLLDNIWDNELRYLWRGEDDEVIALDTATWGCELLRRINEEAKAFEAISFMRKTLITTDDNSILAGLDSMGPVGLWCEGTAHYITVGGEDSQYFLDVLLSLQQSDGGMLASTDNWNSMFGMLLPWTGLASTCWFYFSMTESPFHSY